MRRITLILTVAVVALLAPAASNAQVLELTTWPAVHVVAAPVAAAPAMVPALLADETPAASTASSRPPVPEPPTGLGRAAVPCGGARSCDGGPPIVQPRPVVPPLVTLTAPFTMTPDFRCYVTFEATIPAGTGELVTFGRRNYGSTGPFVTVYAAYTVNGKASILTPAATSGGEWQAVWGLETSGLPPLTVSNAIPVGCL